MSYSVRVDYTRTGDKATQRPSEVWPCDTWNEALDVAEGARADDLVRAVIERDQ